MYLLFLISSCMLWWRFCLTLSTNPMTGNVLSWLKTLTQSEHLPSNLSSQFSRAGNSLIGFPSESLVFYPKKIEWAIRSKNERFTHSLIFGERPERFTHDRSFHLSNLSELLMVAHFCWATWAICSHCSILVSDLSDSLTSLIKKEGMSDSLIF